MARPPPPGGVMHGRVYADGSRLFAEHSYNGLIALQGWAFAIYDEEGKVTASAFGITPWWAVGIFVAELWALMNAAQNAFPGNPFFVDCMAVKRGSRNGTAWASAPSRRFARAWIPLAHVLEEYPEAVEWVPAHCNKASVGVKRLSNGAFLSDTDLAANANVDLLAKRGAREYAPTFREKSSILTASALVTDIARWIGICTVLANHICRRNI